MNTNCLPSLLPESAVAAGSCAGDGAAACSADVDDVLALLPVPGGWHSSCTWLRWCRPRPLWDSQKWFRLSFACYERKRISKDYTNRTPPECYSGTHSISVIFIVEVSKGKRVGEREDLYQYLPIESIQEQTNPQLTFEATVLLPERINQQANEK